MTKILIRLISIERNPEYVPAGVKNYIPGPRIISFIYKGEELPSIFENNINCTVNQYNWDSVANTFTISGYITDSTLVDKAMLLPEAEINRLEIIATAKPIDITSIFDSGPKYLYEYNHVNVTCEECDADFSSALLQTDHEDLYMDDRLNFTDTKCPFCGVWDCCEVERETIEEALIRKDQNNE